MENLKGKDVFWAICDSLRSLDQRPIDHGIRTAYIMYKMLKHKGNYAPAVLADFFVLAALHDVGVYKTDNIDNMLNYEFNKYRAHSVFGFLLLSEYFPPMESKAKMLLFHRVGYKKIPKRDFMYGFETDVLSLAEAADVYHHAMGQTFDSHMFAKQIGSKYSQEVFDLLNEVSKEEKIFEALRYEQYMPEVEEILEHLHLNELGKQQYLEFAMFCLGLQSTNIKAVVVPDWEENVAKVIAGDKASAQEKFWDKSDSIAWNMDSLYSKYMAVLQVLQV
ncbi:MAG: hypothetical protein E7284_08340 [Lachnospiraceae bacterium]|nr:hypothetical protein [Lachnospiraceae bacterium]